MTSPPNQNKTSITTHRKVKGAPDYDDAAYWDTKFVSGQDPGEWLNEGVVLIDAAISELEQRYSNYNETREIRQKQGSLPRALHLGPGISSLGDKLCEAFVRRNWKGSDIVNVDFSSEAVRLGRERENAKCDSRDNAMTWVNADLRSWQDVSNKILPLAPFDVILDKSTSDAIATSEPPVFHRSSVGVSVSDDGITICPALRDILMDDSNFREAEEGSLALSPVELLSMHLFSLAREGAIWLVLSYSSVRFHGLPFLNQFWTVISSTQLKAPSGQTSSDFAMVPDVFHWVYVLRRK